MHPTVINISQWYPEVLHFCPTTPIMLLGLKSDLRNKQNCIELLKTQGLTPVTTAQGEAVAKRMGALYMECSSKERIGVEEIFDQAVVLAVGDEYKPVEEPRSSRAGRSSTQARMQNAPPGGFKTLPKKKKKSCKIL